METKQEVKESDTFDCALCGESKPLSEIRVLKYFRPPLVTCPDCQKIWDR